MEALGEGWVERRRSVDGRLETYYERAVGDGEVERVFDRSTLLGTRVLGAGSVSIAGSAASPPRPGGRPSRPVEKPAGTAEIVLTDRARAAVESAAAVTARDGLEVAGLLFGRHDGDRIIVDEVERTDYARTETSVSFRTSSSWRFGKTVCGAFHAHPVGDPGDPSGNDLEFMRRDFEEKGSPRADLIVELEPLRSGRTHFRLHSFVTDERGTRRARLRRDTHATSYPFA